jgi:hypothetical protein
MLLEKLSLSVLLFFLLEKYFLHMYYKVSPHSNKNGYHQNNKR